MHHAGHCLRLRGDDVTISVHLLTRNATKQLRFRLLEILQIRRVTAKKKKNLLVILDNDQFGTHLLYFTVRLF